MTYRELIKETEEELKEKGLDTSVAKEFLLYCLKITPTELYKNYEKEINEYELKAFQIGIDAYINDGIPIQYLTGIVYFYGRKFKVDENVLIPRPETEEMVSIILKKFPKNLKVLELGTGSGVIAVTLNLEGGHDVTATDISDDALIIASNNALANNSDIEIINSDIYSDIYDKYDLIVSNPPYIPDFDEVGHGVSYEPPEALFAGEDGLDIIKEIIIDLDSYLNPNGALILEHGYNQADMIKGLVRKYLKGYKAITLKDLQKKERFTIIKRSFLWKKET